MSHTNGPSPTPVAAIDLGSNSFHLLVARSSPGELVVIDRLREMVQLAAGLDDSRKINEKAQERALECLRRFGQRVGHIPPENVRAVGTNTLRSAKNARRFLIEAESALGHRIETISGIEEARLIYLGVMQSIPGAGSRSLVLDIGGGSTELIVGEGYTPLEMESLYMGCVTMSRKHFAGGELTGAAWRKAELAALQELEPLRSRYRKAGWDQAVGASGTIRTAWSVVREAGWSQDGITAKSLRRLRDALLKAGHVEKLQLEGLAEARAGVFPGGVVLLQAAFESLGIERMVPSDGALREGILTDLLGRFREEDVRTRSVAALADRFHVDREQSARIEGTALRFLAQSEGGWGINTREARQLLTWAALLHEIGLDIAHQQYHRHGEYIIAEADLFGFSREEQKALATLVRAHRRKFTVSIIKELPPPWLRMTEKLAVIFRLSVVLHRSRTPAPLPAATLAVKKRTIKLSFPAGWLDDHPLTQADLQQESDYLIAAGFKLDFS